MVVRFSILKFLLQHKSINSQKKRDIDRYKIIGGFE